MWTGQNLIREYMSQRKPLLWRTLRSVKPVLWRILRSVKLVFKRISRSVNFHLKFLKSFYKILTKVILTKFLVWNLKRLKSAITSTTSERQLFPATPLNNCFVNDS